MGTRCDFYVGRGKEAEWLGSYPWDGFPDSISQEILKSKSEPTYRDAVTAFLRDGGDKSTLPSQGWPWPWDDSRTTDYSYAFDGGKVYASCFGHQWFDPLKPEPEGDSSKVEFPNMADKKAVTYGARSGLIVVSLPRGVSP